MMIFIDNFLLVLYLSAYKMEIDMTFSCGIDFGTTNTSAAVADGISEPKLVSVEGNSVTIPTALFFADGGHVYFGREAMKLYINGEKGRCMRSLKRVLGTDLMSTGTNVNGKMLKFENILSYFLKHIKAKIDATANADVADVVIGRPVHFRDNDSAGDNKAQDELTRIARDAGFKNIEFQYEPIAAAFAHEKAVEGEKLACVVDIGGGTSDFSIIKIGKNLINKRNRQDDILASTGVRIGGNDFDKDLALKSFMPEFGFGGMGGGKTKYEKVLPLPTAIYRDLAEWSKINTLYVPKEINMAKKMLLAAHEPEKVKRLLEILQNELGHTLLTVVEQTKIALTEKEQTCIELDFLSDAPVIITDKISFENSLQNNVRKITKSVQECLLQAQAKPEDIELVVLTGGSTEIPYVQKIMCSQFANAELAQSNKLSSVGLGLAYDSMRKYA